MTNVIGLRRRRPGEDGDDGDEGGADGALVGPLHAVDGVVGRAAAQGRTDVQALCGAWVRVIGLEDVPDDAGLCPACQDGG